MLFLVSQVEDQFCVPKSKIESPSAAEPQSSSQTVTRNQGIFLREELEIQKEKNDILEGDIQMCKMKIDVKNKDLKRIRAQNTYNKVKCARLENELGEKEQSECTQSEQKPKGNEQQKGF